MDARSDKLAVPLVVDLDGTLIAGDLLWESLVLLLRKNILFLFVAPWWLLAGGRARLKQEIAARVDVNASLLPYRASVIERLKGEKASGRTLILATASARKFADAVAAHTGLFDTVIATEDGVNLSSHRKRDALIARHGDGGFDYMGNSRDDIAVFDAARQGIAVAPDKAALAWQRAHAGELIEGEELKPRTLIKMLRVHQWLKNVLIAVPVVLGHAYADPAKIWAVAIAFISFSAAASAIYIVNDFFDIELDRRHATKRKRPFASGALSIPFGVGAALTLLAISFTAAAFLPPMFHLALGVYLAATTAYSLALKRMLLIDVLTLAGLYTMRIMAGSAATGIEVSFWLIAFSGFFFLSLALVKRFTELHDTQLEKGVRIAGRGYRHEDYEVIGQAGMAATFAATLVLSLYIDSDAIREMYRVPWLIWPLAPIVLYIQMRIWVLARRGEMHEDPVVFIIRDWRSQLVAAFGAILLVAAAW